MSTSETITRTDLKSVLEGITFAIFNYGRGEIGEIKMYGANTPPSGWLVCDGSAVSRTTYADLFAVIGTTFGSGDGSTTFNLPDMRDRFPVGTGSTYSLNDKAGAPTVTLDVTQIPAHRHEIALYNSAYPQQSAPRDCITTNAWENRWSLVADYMDNVGSGQAHNNLPPYIGVNFIIYAKHEKSAVTPKTNIHISASDPTSADGLNGDIWIKYEVSS